MNLGDKLAQIRVLAEEERSAEMARKKEEERRAKAEKREGIRKIFNNALAHIEDSILKGKEPAFKIVNKEVSNMLRFNTKESEYADILDDFVNNLKDKGLRYTWHEKNYPSETGKYHWLYLTVSPIFD